MHRRRAVHIPLNSRYHDHSCSSYPNNIQSHQWLIDHVYFRNLCDILMYFLTPSYILIYKESSSMEGTSSRLGSLKSHESKMSLMWHNGLRITRSSEFGMAGPNASALCSVHHHHHSCFSCSLLFLSLSQMHSSPIQAPKNLTMTGKTIILKMFCLSCFAGTCGHSASPFFVHTTESYHFPSYSSPPIHPPTTSPDTWPSNHVVFCPTPIMDPRCS